MHARMRCTRAHPHTGGVQGPFTAENMRMWLKGGKFAPALPVQFDINTR